MNSLNLGLPKESIYKQFIPKNQFYEHGDFKPADRRAFVEGVERITLYSQLTRANTNIDEFRDEDRYYQEISLILVELRDKSFINRISRLIMENIPYPMLLMARYEDEIIFYAAHHRESKADKDKTVLEEIFSTDFLKIDTTFIDRINYKNLNKQNLYNLYDSYVEAILDYNLQKRNIISSKNKAELLKKVSNIETEIQELKNRIEKEKHFNRKMDLNMKIKRLERKIKDMEG